MQTHSGVMLITHSLVPHDVSSKRRNRKIQIQLVTATVFYSLVIRAVASPHYVYVICVYVCPKVNCNENEKKSIILI